MEYPFWRSVLAKAVTDSKDVFGLRDKAVVALAVLAALIVLFLAAYLGTPDDLKGALLDLASKAAYFLVAFPLVFLWKLVSAPKALFEREVRRTAEATAHIEKLKEERRSDRKTIADLTQPDFSVEVTFLMIGDVVDPPGVQYTLHLTLINGGTPAAVIESSWMMTVKLGGMCIQAEPQTISKLIGLGIDNNRHYYWIDRSDGLDLRAATPIPRLGYTAGVLMFYVPGITCDDARSSGTELIISLKDARRKTYVQGFKVADIMRLKGTRFRPSLRYPMPMDNPPP